MYYTIILILDMYGLYSRYIFPVIYLSGLGSPFLDLAATPRGR